MSALILLLALLPGFVWLLFYLKEDPHPEPKGLIAEVFLSGAVFAFAAFIIQVLLKKIGWAVELPSSAAAAALIQPHVLLFTIFAFALIEELSKFAAAYFSVRKKPEFDEPIDAMIYSVVAALGFATVENLGSIFPGDGQVLALDAAVATLSLRFVGATLLHALAASFIGYYWAISIRKMGAKRYIVLGIALAAVLHAVFNYLIISYGGLVYALIFVVIIGFFALADFEKLKQKAL
jgi:RsiW-degrading membrane proteinase PrsW (M82 family)